MSGAVPLGLGVALALAVRRMRDARHVVLGCGVRFVLSLGLGALLCLTRVTTAWAGAYEDYFQAIETNDARALAALLKRGMDPNTLNPEGIPSLIVAIRSEATQVTQLLLAHQKTKIESRTLSDESPLMMAALFGQEDVVRRLLAKGALVNKTGWTPLHYAATKGHVGIMGLLLERSAQIDARSPNQTTPLMMAAMYGTFEAVRFLMAEGANVLLTNEQQLSALDFAKQANRKDVLTLLTAAVEATKVKGSW